MAYTPGSLAKIVGGFLEDTASIWVYSTADSEATVKGANYFSDALNLGVKKGDLVIVFFPATPALAFLQVAAAPTSSGVAVGATCVVT